MYYLIYITSLLYIGLSLAFLPCSKTQAADIDFGNVLIGAASIQPNVINLDTSKGVPRTIEADILPVSDKFGDEIGFGFTGKSLSLADSATQSEMWIMATRQREAITFRTSNPSFTSLGIYFAPSKSGPASATSTYVTILQTWDAVTTGHNLKGNGIEDDTGNPKLTLDVTAKGNNTAAKQQQSCLNNDKCEEWTVSNSGEIVFTVNPKTQDADVKYVLVKLFINEVGTNNCTLYSFQDTVKQDNFTPEQYFDNMSTSIVNACFVEKWFLTKVNEPFTIETRNQSSTGNGYVQYHFHINGHTDRTPANTEFQIIKWANSQKVFRLRTGTVTPPPATKTLNITVKGNGSVSGENTQGVKRTCSSPPANNPTSPTAGCSWQYDATNPTVTLTTTASLSYSFTGVDAQTKTCHIDPENNKQIIVDLTTSDEPTCTVLFQQTTEAVKIEQFTINDGSTTSIGTSSENPIPIPDNGQLIFFLIKRGDKQHIGAATITNDQTKAGTITVKNPVAKTTYDLMARNGSMDYNVGAFTNINSRSIAVKLTPPSTKDIGIENLTDLTVRRSLRESQTDKIEATVEYQDQSGVTQRLTSFATIYVAAAEPTSAVKACIALKTTDGNTIPLTDVNPPLMFKNKEDITLTSCSTEGLQYSWHLIPPNGSARPEYFTSNGLAIGKDGEGMYTVSLVVSTLTGDVAVATVRVLKSALSAEFNATTNVDQVTLSATQTGLQYDWWQQTQKLNTDNKQVINATISNASGSNKSVFTLQVTSNASNATKQQDTIAKAVAFETAKFPTPKVAVSLPQQGVLTFNLDASKSCDEDNLPNATDLTMKNACHNDNANIPDKGIKNWKWEIGQVNPTTGVQVVQPNFGKQESITTVTLTDALGTANTVQVPVKLTVTDDDPNVVKLSPIDVTLTLNRPKAEGFTVSQNANAGGTKTVTAAFNITDQVKSSYSYSTSNNSTPTPIIITEAMSISCEWVVDLVPAVNTTTSATECSFQQDLQNREHTISLTVTDNYGLKSKAVTQTIFVGDPLSSPPDVTGTGRVEKPGQSTIIQSEIQSDSKFFGAVCIDDKCQQQQSLKATKEPGKIAHFKVNIQSSSSPNSNVKMLLLWVIEGKIVNESTGEREYSYFSITDSGLSHITPGDNWLFNLHPYSTQDLPLPSNYIYPNFDVDTSALNPTKYYLFYGYQYTENGTNTLVYAPTPLILEVTP